ncbi:MAG TPA: hypothetical protein VLX59_10620 [Acidimicrobiales bacterium]|nr:hypothetical protein [Acidimicrobiales bacterium]
MPATWAINSPRTAGPEGWWQSLRAFLPVSAVSALNGETAAAVPHLVRALPMALDAGTTGHVLEGVWVAAARAAQQGRMEDAATLLAGAARHADPPGISGLALYRDCREQAEQATLASGQSLEQAMLRGQTLTLDELVGVAGTVLRGPEIQSGARPRPSQLK